MDPVSEEKDGFRGRKFLGDWGEFVDCRDQVDVSDLLGRWPWYGELAILRVAGDGWDICEAGNLPVLAGKALGGRVWRRLLLLGLCERFTGEMSEKSRSSLFDC